MAKKLTAASVAKLRAGKDRREIPDAGCRCLYLLIGTSGAKSWTFRYRRPGTSVTAKLTLGTTDTTGRKPLPADQLRHGMALTLAEARTLATQAALAVANDLDPGVDRQIQKHERKVEAQTADQRTYPSFARTYITRHAKANRRDWRDVSRLLGVDPDTDELKIIPGSTAERGPQPAGASILEPEVIAGTRLPPEDG